MRRDEKTSWNSVGIRDESGTKALVNLKNSARIRIVLANSSLVEYPEGGGMWMLFLQHLLGLNSLGHDVYWLEVFNSTGNPEHDAKLRGIFFDRMNSYGIGDRCILIQNPGKTWKQPLEGVDTFGCSRAQIKEIIESADLLWNFAYALHPPLLMAFKRRVFIDIDPGIIQVSALSWNMGQSDHDVFLTVGRNLHQADCLVPTLGLEWHPFPPLVFLPMWTVTPDPGASAPITTVTQWNWKEIWEEPERSISKRAAYLRYLTLPQEAGRPFWLAANIHPADDTGDREMLRANGWHLVHPHETAGSPQDYAKFIALSRAELCCPKPIYRELKTGWLSDRSACYLASGRPVLAEDTGIDGHYPTGNGLLIFRDMAGAVAAVQELDGNFCHHSRAARKFAEDHLDSAVWLEKMIEVCG
jgi:hypothetical protein